ncbi:MAG: hypothetical protein AB1424_00925 [Thermodesulfobacteriota bacterium]
MAVKVREKIKGSNEWWIFINFRRQRKSIKVGPKLEAEKTAKECREKIAQLKINEFIGGGNIMVNYTLSKKEMIGIVAKYNKSVCASEIRGRYYPNETVQSIAFLLARLFKTGELIRHKVGAVFFYKRATEEEIIHEAPPFHLEPAINLEPRATSPQEMTAVEEIILRLSRTIERLLEENDRLKPENERLLGQEKRLAAESEELLRETLRLEEEVKSLKEQVESYKEEAVQLRQFKTPAKTDLLPRVAHAMAVFGD